ncbi:MAG: hypothetical protein IT208_10145 [Chthonomonadales bacterium]|nr:hypothetical protein [Chthonomonadales bacterium]
MLSSNTALCPHCRSENLANRCACWRCGRSLPTFHTLDDRAAWQRLRASRAAGPDAQAEGLLAPDSASDRPDGAESKRLIWFMRRRANHP